LHSKVSNIVKPFDEGDMGFNLDFELLSTVKIEKKSGYEPLTSNSNANPSSSDTNT
jgi:hypothetical protein